MLKTWEKTCCGASILAVGWGLKGARARLLAEGSQRHTEQWSGCRLPWSSWRG
jgi:hypothetical protein